MSDLDDVAVQTVDEVEEGRAFFHKPGGVAHIIKTDWRSYRRDTLCGSSSPSTQKATDPNGKVCRRCARLYAREDA